MDKKSIKEEIRSVQRICPMLFHSIIYTIIPNSRLQRTALLYWL